MVVRMKVLTGLLIVITAIPASAKETILCRSSGSPDTVITLGASTQFNRTLDCIAGNFAADMTPCAPDGGYGLSAPTGAADLVGVVDRWQDYADHTGGVVSHYIKDETIYFAGGFNAPGNGGLTDKWSFTLNRLTGQAELKELSGQSPHSSGQLRNLSPAKSVRYKCQ
jgi:hypothetical protein